MLQSTIVSTRQRSRVVRPAVCPLSLRPLVNAISREAISLHVMEGFECNVA